VLKKHSFKAKEEKATAHQSGKEEMVGLCFEAQGVVDSGGLEEGNLVR